MERGEAEHLMPVFNAEERIKKGELKREDIPYMQRGGVSTLRLPFSLTCLSSYDI